VHLANLAAATTYHYLVPGGVDHHFATGGGGPFTFVAYGDQGSTSTVSGTAGGGCALNDPGGGPGMAGIPEATASQANGASPLVGLYMGDCSYGAGTSPPWDAWFAANTPLSADRPWLVTVGNHDEPNFQGPGTATDATNFYFRQFFPAPFAPAADKAWWSTDVSGVHFIFLQADDYGSNEQLLWLKSDLGSAAAQGADWRVVIMHQPPFCSSCYGGDTYEAGAKNTFVPVFDSFAQTAHVDLVLQGHRHVYERTLMLKTTGAQIDPGTYDANTKTYTMPPGSGTIYLTTGAGGHSLHGWATSPAWSANRRSFFHWMEFAVTPSQIVAKVHDTANAGAVWESFTIQRGAGTVDLGGVVDLAMPPGPDMAMPPGPDMAMKPPDLSGIDLAGSDLSTTEIHDMAQPAGDMAATAGDMAASAGDMASGPLPDGAARGDGGTARDLAAGGADLGGAMPPGDCSCRVGGRSSRSGLLFLGLLGLVALARRRTMRTR
jgi:MYXO-CTERM domain-containing protein